MIDRQKDRHAERCAQQSIMGPLHSMKPIVNDDAVHQSTPIHNLSFSLSLAAAAISINHPKWVLLATHKHLTSHTDKHNKHLTVSHLQRIRSGQVMSASNHFTSQLTSSTRGLPSRTLPNKPDHHTHPLFLAIYAQKRSRFLIGRAQPLCGIRLHNRFLRPRRHALGA